ncbi:MAG: hypothetical protein JW780_04065 [Clostridiales bacterium]|nr:hypothetical protein [Clostridiales bacterium]
MIDSFRSTLAFIKQYWITFLVFCLAGAGLFITSVFLQYQAEELKHGIDRKSTYTLSRYTFRVSDCDKNSFDAFSQTLALRGCAPKYIVLASGADLGIRTGESIAGNVAALWPDFPASNEDLLIEYGSVNFSSPDTDVIISHPFDNDLARGIMDCLGNQTSFFRTTPTTKIIGDMTINGSTPHQPIGIVNFCEILGTEDFFNQGVFVAYEHFFDVSRVSDALIIQYDESLKPEEEEILYDAAAELLTVQHLAKPYQRSELDWVDIEYKKKVSQNTILLSLCAVGIFFVFSYLIRLRRPEFRIARIVGASRSNILTQSAFLFLASALCSLSLGISFLFILKSVSPVDRWLETLTARDIFTSSWIYVATLSGCAVLSMIIRLISVGRLSTEEDR